MALGMRCCFLCIEGIINTLTFGTFSHLLQCLERHDVALKSGNRNRLGCEVLSLLIYLATMHVTRKEYLAITL